MYINMSTGRNLSCCNPRVKEAACSGLVQTLLECMYASVIWELHTDNLCQERGKVQRRAVRFVKSVYYNFVPGTIMNYLAEIGWKLLRQRR